MEAIGQSEANVYSTYLANVELFLRDVLAKERIDDGDYVDGTQRVEFYADHLRTDRQFTIDELVHPTDFESRIRAFEEALFARVLKPRDFNLLVLLGGLGAGKTTTVDYLLRRFNERASEIRESCPCACSFCFRQPIFLDFRHLGQPPLPPPAETTTTIFRTIRKTLYSRLISEWLESHRISSAEIETLDKSFLVLRRLMIVNDLMLWEGPEHPEFVALDYRPLRLPKPLFSTSPSKPAIKDLVTKYQDHARDFDEIILENLSDPRKSKIFVTYLLQFYLYRCHPNNPKSLVIIDNLDQLPSEHIEHFMRQFHDVASRTSGLPILVPLRPSSLNPLGFPRDICYTYHYGPNNFEMILRRIENYVLGRSSGAIRGLVDDGIPPVFTAPPSEPEYRAFLFASYFYARLLASALPSRKLTLHIDNTFLERIELPSDSLADLAETADALVGTCCRYAFDLVQRYFRNIYNHPTLLWRAEKRLATKSKGMTLLLDFPLIVHALLREPRGGQKGVSRVANLFQPSLPGTKTGWPSLAKLRALAALNREKRLEVRQIVARAAKFGLPAEASIAALNSLHDKFRLLVWFSTNQELVPGKESSLAEDVVISEHGLGYFSRVIGDFEYLWFCAAELGFSKSESDMPRFTDKLHLYHDLVRKVGVVEWLQHGIRRLEGTEPSDVGRTGEKGRMFVLTLLYSSLARLLRSAGIILKQGGRSSTIIAEVGPRLVAIMRELLFWQNKYRIMYLTNGFITEYELPIRRLSEELIEFGRSGLSFGELEAVIEEVQQSWYGSVPEVYATIDELSLTTAPSEDIVTVIARYGRGLIPGVEKWVQSLDKQARVKSYVGAFLESREKLGKALASRVPTFVDLQKTLTFVHGDAEAVVASARDVAATGGDTLDWFLREKSKLSDMLEAVRSSRFEIGAVVYKDEMSEHKKRCNRLLAVCNELSRSLLVPDHWHLSLSWEESESAVDG